MTRPRQAPPRVSIVTPSLNQGRFIRQAIDSVLAQGYSHVEYLVMDGGSTDGTLDVLRSYGERLTWASESDAGQADAIANGFERCRGDVLGWLNADDVLAPDAVEHAVREFERSPETGLIYGRGTILDKDGAETGPFAGIEPFNLWRLLHTLDYVLQPAAFFRRDAYEASGGLDRGLHWAMDWDLWLKLAGVAEVRFLDRVLAGSREWGATKTATGGWRRIRELGSLAKRHAGRSWTPGVRLYALDTLRQKLRAALPALSGAVDSGVAFASRRILEGYEVHADGWLGPRAHLVVPRRWGGFEVELEAHRLPSSGRLNVRFSCAGEALGVWTAEAAGSGRLRFCLPAGEGPFAEVRLDSDFSFSSRQDRRRLSVRCTGLRRSVG